MGSALGGGISRSALFVGGYAGGAWLAPLAAFAARWRRWIEPNQVVSVAIGCIVGFLVAATIATNSTRMQSPVVPLASTVVTGSVH